jgi:hypothetical protein
VFRENLHTGSLGICIISPQHYPLKTLKYSKGQSLPLELNSQFLYCRTHNHVSPETGGKCEVASLRHTTIGQILLAIHLSKTYVHNCSLNLHPPSLLFQEKMSSTDLPLQSPLMSESEKEALKEILATHEGPCVLLEN